MVPLNMKNSSHDLLPLSLNSSDCQPVMGAIASVMEANGCRKLGDFEGASCFEQYDAFVDATLPNNTVPFLPHLPYPPSSPSILPCTDQRGRARGRPQ